VKPHSLLAKVRKRYLDNLQHLSLVQILPRDSSNQILLLFGRRGRRQLREERREVEVCIEGVSKRRSFRRWRRRWSRSGEGV
jgi:hypothetical protein